MGKQDLFFPFLLQLSDSHCPAFIYTYATHIHFHLLLKETLFPTVEAAGSLGAVCDKDSRHTVSTSRPCNAVSVVRNSRKPGLKKRGK